MQGGFAASLLREWFSPARVAVSVGLMAGAWGWWGLGAGGWCLWGLVGAGACGGWWLWWLVRALNRGALASVCGDS